MRTLSVWAWKFYQKKVVALNFKYWEYFDKSC